MNIETNWSLKKIYKDIEFKILTPYLFETSSFISKFNFIREMNNVVVETKNNIDIFYTKPYIFKGDTYLTLYVKRVSKYYHDYERCCNFQINIIFSRTNALDETIEPEKEYYTNYF